MKRNALCAAVLFTAFTAATIAVSTPALLAQDVASKDRVARGSKLASFERVEDDGTIVLGVDDKERSVTLIGVEWPADEDDAQDARAFLERLLLGESVIVDEPAENSPATRPAGGEPKEKAAIAAAYLRRAPDRLFVNVEMLRLGYARVLAKPSFAQLADFREAEKKARDAGKGVWADKESVSKRDSRRTREKGEVAAGDQKGTDTKNDDGGAKSRSSGPTDAVFVTPTGKKYHRGDCRFAANSRSISLRDALEKGYTPCSRCKPPNR